MSVFGEKPELHLKQLWVWFDLNLMEGECKVGQAVSSWSDGVIALSRLPESSSWLNEKIFVHGKKKFPLLKDWQNLCRLFPAWFFISCQQKQDIFLLLNKTNIVHFSLKLLWLSYNNTGGPFECAEAARRNSFKTSVGSGIYLVLCLTCVVYFFKC